MTTLDPAGRSVSPAAASGEALRHGWFYRAVAVDGDARVLAIAAPFVGRWFANVVHDSSLAGVAAQPGTFGLVVLHGTLGGLPTPARAFEAMHALLATDGIAIVAGFNRWRTIAGARAGVPSATTRGYLRAARGAGFSDTRIHFARPDLDDMTLVVTAEPRSAYAFFRSECATARAAGRTRPTWLARPYARVASWLEPFYVVVARKC